MVPTRPTPANGNSIDVLSTCLAIVTSLARWRLGTRLYYEAASVDFRSVLRRSISAFPALDIAADN